MKTIDNAVLAFYEEGREYNRLRTDIGLIEFERTKEILLETLPKPPAIMHRQRTTHSKAEQRHMHHRIRLPKLIL